jgi:hypothetical protein
MLLQTPFSLTEQGFYYLAHVNTSLMTSVAPSPRTAYEVDLPDRVSKCLYLPISGFPNGFLQCSGVKR